MPAGTLEIEVPDVGIVEFPAETKPADIEAILNRTYGPKGTPEVPEFKSPIELPKAAPGEKSVYEEPTWMDEPTVKLGDFLIKGPHEAKSPTEEGVNKTLREGINSLTSPRNLLYMLGSMGLAATGQAAKALVGAIWTGAMGANAIQNAPQLYARMGEEMAKPPEKRDKELLGELGTQAFIDTGFFVAPAVGLKKVLTETPKITPTPEVTDASKVQETAAVHGAMQSQPEQGLREVPIQESGTGVQPQAPQGEVPLKPTVTETTPPVPASEMPKTPSQTGLYPAVREVGGKVDVAEAGTTHPQIIKEEGLKAEDIDQRGFVDESGKFKDREQAAAQSGVPTEREPGRQHSTDLPEAQETFAQREARLFHESQLRQSVPAAQLPKPTTKLPDLVKKLGRNEVNALLGEWEDGAELSADGKYIKSWSDPRNPTSKSRVPATEFLSWYEQKAKAPTPVDVPQAAVKPVQERLLIKPRTDNMVSLEASGGARIGTFKTVDEAAAWAKENGYGIAPGSPLKPATPKPIEFPITGKQMDEARRKVKRHYELKRLATEQEVQAEIRNLLRRDAAGTLDDRSQLLMSSMETGKEPINFDKFRPKPPEELAGPGTPSAAQPPDPKAAIEALEESFRNIQGPKPTLPEQVKKAFSVGEKASRAKDAVSSALQGMKSAGDYLINKWKGEPKLDDMLRAKGELSAELEKRGWRVRQFVKTVEKAMPTERQRAAVLKWVDAGGDPAELQRGLSETKPEFKQAYADALALKGDDLIAAQNIRSYFDERLDDAVNAGVLETGVENYIRRLYERDPKAQKQALAYVQSGLLQQNPGLVKKRVFQFDWEAERAGYRPVQDFLPRIATYESELSKAIAARKFVRQMVGYEEGNKRFPGMKAPDGRPVVDVAGLGVPVEDSAGVREATLIKPSFKPGDETDPKNNRRDYVERDYPALRKWRWTTLDAGGKPIFVQGNLLIHPDFAGRVDALLEPSRVRHGRYPTLGKAALGVSSTVKQTMLDLSGFHQVQITVHGMEHKVMPWRIVQDIDFTNPNMDGLLKGGLTLGGEYYSAHHGEGLVGSALTRHIPFLGPLMESYHNWLFQSYIPRIKTTMALNALERNRARYKGKLTEEQIYTKTASEANSAFGELNYIMLERSKTTQDMARLIMLAPDFLEARGRFAGGALEKGGKGFGQEQRAALLLGALTMYVTARIANKLTDDKYHFEPENAFSLVHNGHAYSLRTVQGDILHLLEQPVQFWMNRLNPVFGRTALELATGRDYFGRKRSVPEALWDTVKNTVPIALRSSQERKLWESMMNSMGVTARRWNDVDKAFTLAKDWKKQHGVVERGEFIYDPEKDPLRGLKIALSRSDDVGAAKEIKKLLSSKVYTREKLNAYFDRYAKMPFTGSVSNDKKWESGLTQDQKAIVEGARQHKLAIRNLYRQARAKYDDLAKTPLTP